MAGTYEYSVVDFTESLQASFIGSNNDPDERYSPRILANDRDRGANVLAMLKAELSDCTSFAFSVAFITASGMQVLVDILSDLKARNIPGKILTSTYLNYNDPDALEKLREYPNIESRVYQGDLHAKGYFFNKKQISTIIIGSSNLTQRALTCNKEWNILFRSFPNGSMLLDAQKEFNKLWNDEETTALTQSWIADYRHYLNRQKPSEAMSKPNAPFRRIENPQLEESRNESAEQAATHPRIAPNKMQQSALEALDVLHERHEPRALLVSATGTGKTYLSALDIKRQGPRRVLFIVHRMRILSASKDSFERVLGCRYSYGLYQGARRSGESTCVFAMIGTLAKHLDDFSPEDFDYLVIDEAHRTGAAGYRAILDYFKPKFVLGMTATPSRTDGYDVYSLFNHVIAYRISLQDALENDMLAPFHYFGIADLEIDDETCDDVALFGKLTSEAQLDHIIRKIEEYTVEKSCRKGLVFCSRNEEASYFAQAFSERGLPSKAISGASSDTERDETIRQLEQGDIEYIFSVDIMNEGVDIPSLSQIIMLQKPNRPSSSSNSLGAACESTRGKSTRSFSISSEITSAITSSRSRFRETEPTTKTLFERL